ncbi:MAG: FAD-binding protein [Bacteroidota bacterium]
MMKNLAIQLAKEGLHVHLCHEELPSRTVMHNLDHDIPKLVVWPKSIPEVQKALQLISPFRKLYDIPATVVSGGHGYDGGAMCKGIVIDMQYMNACTIHHQKLMVQAGCGLRKVIQVLKAHNRVVPHGDALTVAVGGHFISAGWDLVLTRTFGIGCQLVEEATFVHWDGSFEYVTEQSNPELLHQIRGSFGGFRGIVTELCLPSFELPNETHLASVHVDPSIFPPDILETSFYLPKEISSTFRFYFHQNRPQFEWVVGTLLEKEKTLNILATKISQEASKLVSQHWRCHDLFDVRMLPLLDNTRDDFEAIAQMTTEEFEAVAMNYWKRDVYLREMKVAYTQQRSYWVDIESSNDIFQDILDFLATIPASLHPYVYGNITIGGGTFWENRERLSMPVGKAVIRFEVHSMKKEVHHSCAQEIADTFTQISEPYWEKKLAGAVYSGDEFVRER